MRTLLSAAFALSILVCVSAIIPMSASSQAFRARDLGVPFEGTPGPLNAITDAVDVSPISSLRHREFF